MLRPSSLSYGAARVFKLPEIAHRVNIRPKTVDKVHSTYAILSFANITITLSAWNNKYKLFNKEKKHNSNNQGEYSNEPELVIRRDLLNKYPIIISSKTCFIPLLLDSKPVYFCKKITNDIPNITLLPSQIETNCETENYINSSEKISTQVKQTTEDIYEDIIDIHRNKIDTNFDNSFHHSNESEIHKNSTIDSNYNTITIHNDSLIKSNKNYKTDISLNDISHSKQKSDDSNTNKSNNVDKSETYIDIKVNKTNNEEKYYYNEGSSNYISLDLELPRYVNIVLQSDFDLPLAFTLKNFTDLTLCKLYYTAQSNIVIPALTSILITVLHGIHGYNKIFKETSETEQSIKLYNLIQTRVKIPFAKGGYVSLKDVKRLSAISQPLPNCLYTFPLGVQDPNSPNLLGLYTLLLVSTLPRNCLTKLTAMLDRGGKEKSFIIATSLGLLNETHDKEHNINSELLEFLTSSNLDQLGMYISSKNIPCVIEQCSNKSIKTSLSTNIPADQETAKIQMTKMYHMISVSGGWTFSIPQKKQYSEKVIAELVLKNMSDIKCNDELAESYTILRNLPYGVTLHLIQEALKPIGLLKDIIICNNCEVQKSEPKVKNTKSIRLNRGSVSKRIALLQWESTIGYKQALMPILRHFGVSIKTKYEHLQCFMEPASDRVSISFSQNNATFLLHDIIQLIENALSTESIKIRVIPRTLSNPGILSKSNYVTDVVLRCGTFTTAISSFQKLANLKLNGHPVCVSLASRPAELVPFEEQGYTGDIYARECTPLPKYLTHHQQFSDRAITPLSKWYSPQESQKISQQFVEKSIGSLLK